MVSISNVRDAGRDERPIEAARHDFCDSSAAWPIKDWNRRQIGCGTRRNIL